VLIGLKLLKGIDMQKIEYVDSSEIQRRVGELLANSTMINIQDDRDGSGMWIVIHQTKPTILHTKMIDLYKNIIEDTP
jgi:hypothetical protein